eukprot:GSChrysophyteH1.ASY1.ANO1.1140.1 assembled CDS
MSSLLSKKRPRVVTEAEQYLMDSVFGTTLGETSRKSTSNGVEEDEEDEISVSLELDRKGSAASGSKAPRTSEAAWNDDDDDDLQVDLRKTDRLRKLQKADSEGKLNAKDSEVSGSQLSRLLRERFQRSPLDWAHYNEKESSDVDGLLQSTDTMLQKKGGRARGDLPSGRIDIQRLGDANAAEPSKGPIRCMQFHQNSSVLMTGGADRFLRFFQVDGDRNEHLLGVRFNELPISKAAFLGGGGEVVLSGRKPFFFSYDTDSGKVTKVPGLMGKDVKSYENMLVSPKGTRLAFLGQGGYVHIADGRTKSWIGDVKMNTAARCAVFSDENSLFSSGLDADIYKWDLRMAGSRCISRWKNVDGTCVTSLALGKNVSSSYLAAGSESGVLTLYDGNVPSGMEAPTTLKTAMNLTTKVTSCEFHPSTQCLSYASPEQNDHLRVMHVASGAVYHNWPTKETPLRKVQALSFSPGGGYMAIGNDKGKVLLYRLNHFSQY